MIIKTINNFRRRETYSKVRTLMGEFTKILFGLFGILLGLVCRNLTNNYLSELLTFSQFGKYILIVSLLYCHLQYNYIQFEDISLIR